MDALLDAGERVDAATADGHRTVGDADLAAVGRRGLVDLAGLARPLQAVGEVAHLLPPQQAEAALGAVLQVLAEPATDLVVGEVADRERHRVARVVEHERDAAVDRGRHREAVRDVGRDRAP